MSQIFDSIKTDSALPTYKYFVGGEWQISRNRRLINLYSPIDGSLVGRIQAISPKEADIAVTAASLAQNQWSTLSDAKRLQVVKKTLDLLQKHQKVLSSLLTLEVGKLKKEAEAEVDHTIHLIEETLKTKWSFASSLKIENEVCRVLKEPVGVVLAITPFNYPLYTTVTKIIPALLVGNAVVLKPSVFGSITVLHLAKIMEEAGLLPGVLNVVTGHGEQIGRYLAQHDLVNLISFTGSSRVGKEIAQKATLAGLILELGGKDPAIVLEDADLELAAKEIADGAFTYAGQRCMAIKRVLVVKKIKKPFLEKLKQTTVVRFGVLGDPRDPKVQLGPVISDFQADYLEGLLKDALKKGAAIVFGGKRMAVIPQKIQLAKRILAFSKRLIRLKKGHGRYWQATILDEVTPAMRIAWEEQFGPLLPIITVNNAEEAVRLANASEYGLDACIFTQDTVRAEELAGKLQVGQVFINQRPHRRPDQFPFSGVKSSGLGVQGIDYSLEAMTRVKSIRQ